MDFGKRAVHLANYLCLCASVCAVHGLNGNAFDTWTTEKNVLWLTDLLPTAPGFEKARIMVFGYTSGLLDQKKAHDRLKDYAKELLNQLQFIRASPSEASRPLILICHSMGGIVSRLAMIQLKNTPGSYPGITPSQCGLLFLSTPHFGSGAADFNVFLRVVGKALGVRKTLIDNLKMLNIHAVDSVEDWQAMAVKPIVKCLVEAEDTPLPMFQRRLVSYLRSRCIFLTWRQGDDMFVFPKRERSVCC